MQKDNAQPTSSNSRQTMDTVTEQIPQASKSHWQRLRAWLVLITPGHIPIVYKIALSISVLMVVCIGFLALVIVQNQNRDMRDQVDALGNTLATQIARSALEPLLADDRLALGVLATSLTADDTLLGMVILSSRGEILAESGLTPFQADAPLAGESTSSDIRQLRGLEWSLPNQHDPRTANLITYTREARFQDVVAGHVIVTLSRSGLDQSLRGATHTILFASLVVIIIGAILTVFLSRKLSKPIHDLMDANQALESGQHHIRFADRRNDEIGELMSSFNRYAAGIQHTTHMESTLSRYLSPSVARQIITNSTPVELGGQCVEATVLFADIVGFTRMTEGMQPEHVSKLLNRYFTHIARACEMHQGMIDKYMGDCAMLVFGVPQADPQHYVNGILCALTIQRLVTMENQTSAAHGHAPVHFRLGINSGQMLAGNLGAQERMEYTVVGESVNLASRLGAVATADQIIVTEQLYRRPEICERFIARAHKFINLRGIQHPVATYIIEGVMPAYKDSFDRQVQQLWWQGHRRSA